MFNFARKTQDISNGSNSNSQSNAEGLAHKELSLFKGLIDGMPVGAMLCDKDDLTVTYANAKSITLLKTIEEHLPIKADDVVGTCIDIFHKNPAMQRGLLKDPKNLPHDATISLGDERLSLHIEAVWDEQGNYIAAALTWNVVTEAEKTDARVKRLMQMIDKMPINAMMCNPETLEITYMNESSIATLRGLEQYLPVKADDLLGTCIDVFHKNPEHQRRILKDPTNLPWSARISVGPETLALEISAIIAEDGTYQAALATWSVITSQAQVEEAVKVSVKEILGDSAMLNSQSDAMSSAAEQNSSVAIAVASAAEEATANVQTMAAATEELGASVSEIGTQIQRAAQISEKAATRTQEADTQVKDLEVAASKIGEVVNLISDIAEQTNLLALNATIEAARAGDAGRGFAVVASEVKSLASQTAKATEDITGQISAIQSETNNVVGAISEIGGVIGEVNEIAASIASASDEQNAVTTEIARNAQEAATGTQEVSQHIIEVQKATEQNAASVEEVRNISQKLEILSKDLQKEVESMLK